MTGINNDLIIKKTIEHIENLEWSRRFKLFWILKHKSAKDKPDTAVTLYTIPYIYFNKNF